LRVHDVAVRIEDLLHAVGCKDMGEYLRLLQAGEIQPSHVEDAAEDLRALALRGDLDHGPIVYAEVSRPAREPADAAFECVDLERDQINKADLLELAGAGVPDTFRKAIERRQDRYMFECDMSAVSAMWAALNDLCRDVGPLGRWSRRIRALRVKAVLHNCAVSGRPMPRVGLA
jgi:hypothetical protein